MRYVCRTAKLKREGSSPTTENKSTISNTKDEAITKKYLDTQTTSFKISTMPIERNVRNKKNNGQTSSENIHIKVSIFSIALATELHKSITTRDVRGLIERSKFSDVIRYIESLREVPSTTKFAKEEIRRH